MTSGVYGFFCAESATCLYVGQSSNIEKREYQHLYLLTRGKHHCRGLQEWYSKTLPDQLEMRVLEEAPVAKLYERELFWFDELSPFYWGRKPGESFRWDELSTEVKAEMFATRAAKKEERLDYLLREYSEAVEHLYLQERYTTEHIAQELPISYAAVLAVLKYNEVPLRTARENVGFTYGRGKSLDELHEELVALREQKLHWHEIAAQWKCSTTSVRTLAVKLGLLTPRKRSSASLALEARDADELKSEIRELYIEGYHSFDDLAKLWGVTRKIAITTVYKHFPVGENDGKSRAARKNSKRH